MARDIPRRREKGTIPTAALVSLGLLDTDISGITRGIANLGGVLQSKEEKQGEYDASIAASKYRVSLSERFSEQKELSEPDATGFKDNWNDSVNAGRKSFEQNIPKNWSSSRKSAYLRKFGSLVQPMDDNSRIQADSFERTKRVSFQTDALKDSMSSQVNFINRTSAYQSPPLLRQPSNKVKTFGAIAAESESGSQGYVAINRKEVNNATSFGKYQFYLSTKGKGTMNDFLKVLESNAIGEEAVKQLKEAGIYKNARSDAVANKWKEVMQNPDLQVMYEDYAKDTFYEKPRSDIINKTGVDIQDRSRALQEAVFSLSLNFGNNAKFIRQVLGDNKDFSDEDVIAALYKRASEKFPMNKSRYEREAKELIELSTKGIMADDRPVVDISSFQHINDMLSDIKNNLESSDIDSLKQDNILQAQTAQLMMAEMTKMSEGDPVMARKVILSGQLDEILTPVEIDKLSLLVNRSEDKLLSSIEDKESSMSSEARASYDLLITEAEDEQSLENIEQDLLEDTNISNLDRLKTQKTIRVKQQRLRKSKRESSNVHTSSMDVIENYKRTFGRDFSGTDVNDAYRYFMSSAEDKANQQVEQLGDNADEETVNEIRLESRSMIRDWFVQKTGTVPSRMAGEFELMFSEGTEETITEALDSIQRIRDMDNGAYNDLPSKTKDMYARLKPLVDSGRFKMAKRLVEDMNDPSKIMKIETITDALNNDFVKVLDEGYSDLRSDLDVSLSEEEARSHEIETRQAFNQLTREYLRHQSELSEDAVEKAMELASNDMKKFYGSSQLARGLIYLPPEQVEVGRQLYDEEGKVIGVNPFDRDDTGKYLKKQLQYELGLELPSTLSGAERKEALESVYLEPLPSNNRTSAFKKHNTVYRVHYQIGGRDRVLNNFNYTPDIFDTPEYRKEIRFTLNDSRKKLISKYSKDIIKEQRKWSPNKELMDDRQQRIDELYNQMNANPEQVGFGPFAQPIRTKEETDEFLRLVREGK